MITRKKRSALVPFLINRFDFSIRFFYSKMKLYKVFNFVYPKIYRSNYEDLNSFFEIIDGHFKKNKFNIDGKSILELGPGNSYINTYNFLQNGARKVILIDKFPRFSITKKQKSYIKDEVNYFKTSHNINKFEYLDEATCSPNQDYITFIAGDLCDFTSGIKVDFILSISVLQHIKGLDQYIRTMHQILNPGGMMYHVIDLKDKFHFFGNPFLFYKYSDFVWENFLTDKAVTYTNRMRYQEYIDIFTANGFDLVWEQITPYDFSKFKINKKFAGRSDLHIGDANFLLKKK
jgi:SAM-dependent methyltransferase